MFNKCLNDVVQLYSKFSNQSTYYYYYDHYGQRNTDAMRAELPPDFDEGLYRNTIESYRTVIHNYLK